MYRPSHVQESMPSQPGVGGAQRARRPGRTLLLALVAGVLLGGCASTEKQGGWFALRWMEKPGAQGPSTRVAEEDLARFEQVLAFDAKEGDARFTEVSSQIREGDVIAYRMSLSDAYRDILKLKLSKVGYRVFRYGHLAIAVHDAAPAPTLGAPLKVFSSESFKGPNLREGIETLRHHDFDVYRLNRWERVDKARLYEFVDASMRKAGKWYGYDFMGMFGLANSNLRPTTPENIGHDYICSTVVVSALYYAGLELDAIQRDGLLDLVTPAQVVDSRGRFFTAGNFQLQVESSE
jgi:hypothetical protein